MQYRFFRSFSLLLLITALLITGCSAPTAVPQPEAVLPSATLPAAAPPERQPTQPAAEPTTTPVSPDSAPTANAPVEYPQVITDPEQFKAALLQALMAQDAEALQRWMSVEFLTAGWRADGSYTSPADALRELYSYYLGTENRLEVVQGADLKALMSDNDPLSGPRVEAGVIEAFLVSGWGKDGRDEAVLYIAREPDNSLKWHGWIVVKGGFSGARTGGAQPYTNEEYGYRIYVPKGYEIQVTSPSSVLVMAPGVGHPGQSRAAAFITVEPANGRTVDQITEGIKAELGPGFNIPPGTAMGLDKSMAIVLTGLPGQDVNRQLFVVYNDLLYHIMFVPDTPEVGAPYWQMEDLYAMIVNTFHFTR